MENYCKRQSNQRDNLRYEKMHLMQHIISMVIWTWEVDFKAPGVPVLPPVEVTISYCSLAPDWEL